jgi:hypothetical protein
MVRFGPKRFKVQEKAVKMVGSGPFRFKPFKVQEKAVKMVEGLAKRLQRKMPVTGSVVDPDLYVFGPPGSGAVIICKDANTSIIK